MNENKSIRELLEETIRYHAKCAQESIRMASYGTADACARHLANASMSSAKASALSEFLNSLPQPIA